MNVCPFCTLPAERIIQKSQHGLIIRDGYPIIPGHTLVIPHRHVDSFFNLTTEERVDLLGPLDKAKTAIKKNSNTLPTTSASMTALPQGRLLRTCIST
jgi:diadenosine tetraphosphate (Ap4A) HIT family hydrolase